MEVISRPIARDLIWQRDLDLYLSNLPSELERLSSAIGEKWYKYTWFDRFMSTYDGILVGPLGLLLFALYAVSIEPHPFAILFASLMFLLVCVTFWGCLDHNSAPAGWIRLFHEDLDSVLERVIVGLGSSGFSFRLIRRAVFHGPELKDVLLLSEADGSRIFLINDHRGTWVHVGPPHRARALSEIVDGVAGKPRGGGTGPNARAGRVV